MSDKHMTPTQKAIADVQQGLKEKFAEQPWAKADPKHGLDAWAEVYALELARIALHNQNLSEFGPSSDLVIDAALWAGRILPEEGNPTIG